MTLHAALAELVGQEELADWLEQPNPAFGGLTPLQLIDAGETDRLWQMVFRVRTGHPV